jgi:hypothetical protein
VLQSHLQKAKHVGDVREPEIRSKAGWPDGDTDAALQRDLAE